MHLAQMPTDQRELEQHRLSIQTGADADGFFGASLCHPCPPERSWAAPRSTLAPSMIPFPAGYTGDQWGVPMLEHSFDHPHHPARSLAESTVYPYYSTPSSNTSSIIAPPSMDHSSSGAIKHREPDDLVDWQTELTPSPWLGPGRFYPAKPEGSPPSIHAVHQHSSSPPMSISSQHSPPRSVSSASPSARVLVPDSTSPRTSLGDHSEEEQSSELPYSSLIYQALLTGEGGQMPLQEIYAWFERNTTKGKDQACKGWQNSIRHNLSMNAVRIPPPHLRMLFQGKDFYLPNHMLTHLHQGFEAIKVDVPGGKRPLSVWRLTDEARRNGKVESTTRYRKPGARRPPVADHPAPSRQGAGSRGGKASKHTAKRNQPNDEHRRELYRSQARLHQSPQRLPQPQSMDSSHPFLPTSTALPPYEGPPIMTSLPRVHRGSSLQTWDFNSVTGCTNPPPTDNPVFCETAEPAPDYTAFDMGPGWYGRGSNNGSITIPEGPL
ncbi:hypothetical protein N7492_009005 [Penicillium capsulatum]|uniref:Fork-head domain-containing protein n=1 Tax=Penicillium capsulatum TaxID=69766 RepID=A0A9W9HT26_9EURO|nr:hypothetical protein N7492_009005 [Penicillium capsulatum]KAJ6106405.1 hypothetical protein N7512_009922 [Penicillium capsulatum]